MRHMSVNVEPRDLTFRRSFARVFFVARPIRSITHCGLPPEEEQFLGRRHLVLIDSCRFAGLGRMVDARLEEDERKGGDGATVRFNISMSPFVCPVEATNKEKKKKKKKKRRETRPRREQVS